MSLNDELKVTPCFVHVEAEEKRFHEFEWDNMISFRLHIPYRSPIQGHANLFHQSFHYLYPCETQLRMIPVHR